MRISILTPTYWPEVRRGSERLAHDLAVTLRDRGHGVSLITAHAGPRTRAVEDGVEVIRTRRLPEVPGLTWYYDEHLRSTPPILRELARDRADVVHALYPGEGWAAALARRHGGPPYVLSVHGIVDRAWLVGRRRRLDMLRAAAAGAAVVGALSDAAAAPLRRYAIADPWILPGGVIGADFAGEGGRPERPTLLCPAALDDPRKRADLLAGAFERVRAARPDARLVLAGSLDPAGPAALRDGVGVERVGAESTEALARAYRAATVTVLPADNEAFGLVLLESLAAGTPVVAARSGACPEIVTGERVGRLFAPGNAGDLARALTEALALAAEPGTAQACREHAAAWDWSRIVCRYEAAYEAALGDPATRRNST